MAQSLLEKNENMKNEIKFKIIDNILKIIIIE